MHGFVSLDNWNHQGQKKAEQQSSIRMSGPKPLEKDRYDKYACAVCLELRAPVLMSEVGAQEREEQLKAEGGTIVQCATCGVQVHRACYGIADDVGGKRMLVKHGACFCSIVCLS